MLLAQLFIAKKTKKEKQKDFKEEQRLLVGANGLLILSLGAFCLALYLFKMFLLSTDPIISHAYLNMFI